MKCSWGSLGLAFQRGLDRTVGIGLLAAVALFSSCHDAAGPAGGWLTAAIREATDTGGRESTYRGTGDFIVTRDPGAGVLFSFELNSDGTGTSAGQKFSLYWPGHGRPRAGRYELAPLEVEDGHLEGFTAVYSRVAGGRGEDFTALSGYVVVRESSDDRVDGVFQMTGVLYCLRNDRPGQDDWCTAPTTITPGAPQVEVTGSFAAVPYKPGVVSVWP